MNKTLSHARKAILREMKMFPCLGLVSKHHNGSHQDMNYQVFKQSYYVVCEMLKTIELQVESIKTFNELKTLGFEYEKLMFQKTNNVNTHKGLIFCFAIFWYAYLKTYEQKDFLKTQNFIKDFCQSLQTTQYEQLNTFGAKIYLEQNVQGARFMALNGYQVVFDTYDFYLNELKDSKFNLKTQNFLLLLKILTLIEDTVAIKKIGLDSYRNFQAESDVLITEILQTKSKKEISDKIFNFNNRAIKSNLSPGGAADLLVLVFFLIQEKN